MLKKLRAVFMFFFFIFAGLFWIHVQMGIVGFEKGHRVLKSEIILFSV
jgi:hypothetical protein